LRRHLHSRLTDFARRVYDRHVGERLFFAGEAGGREFSMTVGGAWLSGHRAASMAVKALRSETVIYGDTDSTTPLRASRPPSMLTISPVT
jgi:hypothetical protein